MATFSRSHGTSSLVAKLQTYVHGYDSGSASRFFVEVHLNFF